MHIVRLYGESPPECKMKMLGCSFAVAVSLLSAMAQQPGPQVRMPDLDAQRAAMRKLTFLVGKWSGQLQVFGQGVTTQLAQTEDAEFKLDGLILTIEGVGRSADGKPGLTAFGIISYDDATHAYHFRAFNDGRYLETEPQVDAEHKRMTWGFQIGDIKTQSVLQIDEKGNWTEVHHITIGQQPPRKLMELTVSPQK